LRADKRSRKRTEGRARDPGDAGVPRGEKGGVGAAADRFKGVGGVE
jgi:hypothetical protein